MTDRDYYDIEIADDEDARVSQIYNQVEQAKAYQSSIGLTRWVPIYVDYYEGRQWARKPAEGTEWLPRVVLNIVKMICRNKKAGVRNSPVRLVYEAEDGNADAKLFTNFTAYMMKEMDMDEHDDNAIDDGCKKGTYIYYFYWDADAVGKDGKYKGGVRCKVLDVLDVYFANPHEKNEQKQNWIIIRTREDIKTVKEWAKDEATRREIRPDDPDEVEYTDGQEQEGSGLVTVYVKFLKKDGEVYYTRATKSVELHEPIPLTPDGASSKMTLYPIVVGQWEEREKSIYGLGEVADLMSIQREINFTLSMCFLNISNNAWNKWLVKDGALPPGFELDNTPGQIVVDLSPPGTGDGVKPLQTPLFNRFPVDLVMEVAEKLRGVAGATEVLSGELPSANMSGTAIAQLQGAAEAPIDDIRKRFWRAKEKQGLVLAQFFKCYYADAVKKPFVYEDEDAEGNTVKLPAEFDGSMFSGTTFDVIVEAGAGTRWSEISVIQSLEMLIQMKAIDVESFIEAYPKSIMPNKTELLKAVQKSRQGTEAQLEQALQQLQNATQIIQNQQKQVESVQKIVNENTSLKKELAVAIAAYNELVQKKKVSDATALATAQALQEAVGDAMQMAQSIGGQK